MTRRIDPRAEPTTEPPPVPVASPASEAPSVDPRIAIIEAAVASGDWRTIVKELGPLEDAARLPPSLGLINAVAHIEGASAQAAAPEAHALAIRSMATIFGVAPESRLAILFAKRLTRRPAVSFRERPAPPPRVSFLIIAVTFVVALALGWVLTSGVVRFHLH